MIFFLAQTKLGIMWANVVMKRSALAFVLTKNPEYVYDHSCKCRSSMYWPEAVSIEAMRKKCTRCFGNRVKPVHFFPVIQLILKLSNIKSVSDW